MVGSMIGNRVRIGWAARAGREERQKRARNLSRVDQLRQDDHPAAAALHEIRGREDKHGVDRLGDAYAGIGLEAKPGHHRGNGIRVRIRVRRTRRRHVRDRRIALAIVGMVCGHQIVGETGVGGERWSEGDDQAPGRIPGSVIVTRRPGYAFSTASVPWCR